MKHLALIFLASLLPALAPSPGTPARSSARWISYDSAVLDDREPYDGDSFFIQTRRSRMIFRLYFVDAPETDLEFPQRVREQGEYWGISDSDVLRLGWEARLFARKFMQDGVTAWTRREDATGRSRQPRVFAIIRAGEDDLAVELARNGLARIFGYGTDLPDGTAAADMWRRLREAEAEARLHRRGGWKRRKN